MSSPLEKERDATLSRPLPLYRSSQAMPKTTGDSGAGKEERPHCVYSASGAPGICRFSNLPEDIFQTQDQFVPLLRDVFPLICGIVPLFRNVFLLLRGVFPLICGVFLLICGIVPVMRGVFAVTLLFALGISWQTTRYFRR